MAAFESHGWRWTKRSLLPIALIKIATKLLASANELSRQSDRLRSQVEGFFASIRAA
jgi:hypothetical protein